MKDKPTLIRKIFIFTIIVFLSLHQFAFCQESKMGHPKDYGFKLFEKGFNKCMNFLKNPDFYNRAIHYIQEERRAIGAFALEPEKAVISVVVDLFLSLLCVWLALWLITGLKTFLYKKYLWFLFILNLGWFILLVVFRGIWEVLYFMVIKLEPNLFGVILDNFTLLVMVTSCFVYIWLLARTFSLRFFGSLRLFFISHLFYLIIIFISSIFLNFVEADWPKLVKENLGLRPMMRGYLSDMNKISTKRNVMSLMRFRVFHL